MKSLSRAPEPEPADEEVLDLIPTDQNIFGLQDISADEEPATLPVEGEEISPEDLEAAIEAELGGRAAARPAMTGGDARALARRAAAACPTGGSAAVAAAAAACRSGRYGLLR